MIPKQDFIIQELLNIPKERIEELSIIKEDKELIIARVTLKKEELACELCGEKMILNGYKDRKISHPALSEYKMILYHHARRYLCKSCGKTRMEENPFAFTGFNSSYLLLRRVMEKLGNLNYSLKMISEECQISPTAINRYLDSYITIPPRELPEWICIDEIHSPELSYKHSSYLCVIVDGEDRDLYDVLGSRSKDYLANYFSSFPSDQREAVRYVTMDMWLPYKAVVQRYFKNCIVAVDPFHVIEHLTHGFERVRINLMNQCPYGSNGYYLLKKWSWLLRKDDVFLDNERIYNSRFKTKLNRRDIEQMIFKSFPILEEAYVLKERYRDFNKKCPYDKAKQQFEEIYAAFKKSDIPEYREFVGILENWKDEIINSFEVPYENHRLSNALCETYNGKIRNYITISKGVANFERFRKRVLYALSKKVFYSISSSLTDKSMPGKARGAYKKVKNDIK